MHGATVSIDPGYIFSKEMNGKQKQVFFGVILIMAMMICNTGYRYQDGDDCKDDDQPVCFGCHLFNLFFDMVCFMALTANLKITILLF